MSKEEMFEEYDRIISIQLWNYPDYMWDDLRSEAYLKYPMAIREWSPKKGRFYTMAYSIIQQQMRNWVRYETRINLRDRILLTLDRPMGDDESTFADYLEDNRELSLEDEIMVRDFWEQDMKASSEDSRRVKKAYYIDGITDMIYLGQLVGIPHSLRPGKDRLRKLLYFNVW